MQLQKFADELVEVQGLAAGTLLTRKGQELADQLGGAIAFLRGLLQIVAGLWRQLMMREHQLQITFHDRQRVVQFMRHTGDHQADGRKFFRLAQLLFEPRAFGKFQQEKLVSRFAVKLDLRAVDLHRHQRSVFPHQVKRVLAANRL